jgi:drug/metabolite transporter (DMT)-like permease
MLTSFIFAANKNNDDKKASIKWLIVCVCASIFCGMIGILQKVHQTSAYKLELNEFLLISFLLSTLISLIWLVIAFKKDGNKFSSINVKDNKKSILTCLLICLISGIAIGTNHKLNLFLSGVMDSATFFPLVNGTGLVLSTLSALVIFRERLSVKQWISVIVGVLSVIFLCNPF